MIIDIDIHHGDGTEHILQVQSYTDPDQKKNPLHTTHLFRIYDATIFPRAKQYDSENVHHYPFFLPPTQKRYHETFDRIVEQIRSLHPILILISCGFDAAKGDTLGNFELLPQDYAEMSKKLLNVCPRVVSVLEGGYNLENLRTCTIAHIRGHA